jgi:3-oxoacyl-[acyl-carrier-protein] synthase-3
MSGDAMYINGVARYVPSTVVRNDDIAQQTGVSTDWIIERCGIVERRWCARNENTNTMGLAAVQSLLRETGTPTFDLIIGATYTPHDTVATLAHYVQNSLSLDDVPTLTVTTACSSVLNAFEIAEGYFASGKARRALIVGSENNSAYLDIADPRSAPLWGDGAVAFDVSSTALGQSRLKVTYLHTGGAATAGKAIEAVNLCPRIIGIPMAHGTDVFSNACFYMERESRRALERAKWSIDDVRYLIPHQANRRISLRVMKSLGVPDHKLISVVEHYGNTGCCGFGIGLAEVLPKLKPKDRIVTVVFGGGYSYGCMLLETLT